IAGAGSAAIFIVNSVNDVVAGNWVGLNSAGTVALGSAQEGISVSNSGQNIRIGTNADGIADAIEANVVVACGTYGVQLADPGCINNVVAGNFIGTDPTGTIAMGN